MNDKINIGILGCANVARKYAIETFKHLNEVDKVFIASRDAGKAEKWAKEFGIEFKNSYEDLINDTSIDAVYIPLPIRFHEEWAIKCAENKKHVICEKSLSFDFDSVKRMVDIFEKEGLVLFENFVCDYHPQHSKILSLINKGEIGNPLVFGSYFGFMVLDGDIRKDENLDTGCLNDIGAYMVLMSMKLFQEEPISVAASFDQNQGTVYMEFPNGKVAFGGFGFNHAYQNNYAVWGSKGLIETKRAYSIAPEAKAIVNLFKANPEGDVNEKIEIESVNQFELIFRDFCRAVINKDDEKRINKYKSILSQGRVMEALRISNKLNKKIFLKQ